MMSDLYRIENVESWSGAKDHLNQLGAGWAFRGQRDSKWALSTSIERASNGKLEPEVVEKLLIRGFRQKAHHYLPAGRQPGNMFEWLAMMQHAGVPTALLDWTRSPYVAAYFAFENLDNAEDVNGHCAVWAINTDWCKSQAMALIPGKLKGKHGINDSSDY